MPQVTHSGDTTNFENYPEDNWQVNAAVVTYLLLHIILTSIAPGHSNLESGQEYIPVVSFLSVCTLHSIVSDGQLKSTVMI